TEDIVYVPDQPSFTFGGGITVAGWFNPSSTRQVRSLMRKRDQGTSDFALLLNDGVWQFVVNLGGGRAASVTAPKKALPKVWTHVAGTYDGTWLRIYIAGLEAAKVKARGTISPGPGPLLMGNDGSERRLDGLMDNLFFDGTAATADQVMALTCVTHDPSIKATPATSAPTLPGAVATYDVAITNNSTSSCAPSQFLFETEAFIPGITIDPQFAVAPPVNGGATTHITMTVTATDDPDPGTYTIPFILFDEMNGGTPAQGSVDFVLAADGCRVSRAKELMITSPTVVDDPVRTTGSGVWTFKHLMEAIAPTPEAAPAMVEAMMKTFTTDETVNTFTIEARPQFQGQVLDTWPRTADGGLDLSQAPFMLQAIVDRFDLRNLSNGDAGEGRFVFGFFPPGSFFPPQATLIMEYKLPAATDADVQGWADAWHGLGALTQGTPEYNAALEAITERFASRGKRPSHPNGSAINAVRTNEIAFGSNGRWQMREFGLSADTGTLVPATIALTPDLSFNGTDTVAAFINANEASIIAETHTVPLQFQGAPFATGSVFNDLEAWTASGINNNEARFHFSLNTCNGCHSASETGTFFLQISPRTPGGEAQLSGFLTGTTVPDPVTGATRAFDDLGRRATDLKSIECPGSVTPPPAGGDGGGAPPSMGADGGVAPPIPVPPGKGPVPLARTTSLRLGISRVH
ncbi:MAG TPA: LamG domain-containing protein, partial [Polyangia bacterium]|nr:LamG domain-containing protein [Polyangia bacterium]